MFLLFGLWDHVYCEIMCTATCVLGGFAWDVCMGLEGLWNLLTEKAVLDIVKSLAFISLSDSVDDAVGGSPFVGLRPFVGLLTSLVY